MTRRGDAGEAWHVEARGKGEPVVVLLPGALGRAELLTRPLQALARRRRTIAVGYGPTTVRPDDLAAGIDGILEREGCARAHLVGCSLGATVALFTARWLARRFASIVLVGCGAPDAARGARIARVLPLLRWVPAAWLRRRWRADLSALLGADDAETDAARVELFQLLARMPHGELVNLRTRQASLDLKAPAFRPLPPETPVLRLEFERDLVISAGERARLGGLVPHAVVETLPGLGHEATLTFPPLLLERIDAWLTA